LERRRPARTKVSLEKCDLGKGAGVVDGAFAEIAAFLRRRRQVMDLETRADVVHGDVQGFKHADLVKKPYPAGGQPVKDLGAIATYVASKSSGMTFAAKLDRPQEKAVVDMGHAIFFRRQGPHDFSCATCHNDSGSAFGCRTAVSRRSEGSQRGRRPVAGLPRLDPQVMTMQHRLYDCYWQMRMPELEIGSDVSVALTAYLVKNARAVRSRRRD